ncbi:MAG: twin-arginine translocation pathway signal protein [Parcubacteria group bacterium Gr01-1014_13]|nr:MAG: twin-arginine translocation pathway signal protein [Parcubacteria group bacterium Gr01-1014_13]
MSQKKFITLITVILVAVAAVVFGGYKFNKKNSGHDYVKLHQEAQKNIGPTGQYQTDDFDPTEFLTTWNFNNLPEKERAKFYKETALADGTLLREYNFFIEDKEIEVAPGVFFPAWAYNGQVPGPTIRATEGDTVKITLINGGSKPHSAHFHGFHSAEMDGSAPEDMVLPGENFTYEFKAGPFGTHVYHCHSYPVSQHITKGLYGAYIVDPKNDTRPKADKELVMVMNGFDTDFDGANDIYAVNTMAFAYNYKPIMVKKGELVRIHLSNMLQFDLVNSFHLHANFFNEYKTGTSLKPDNFTDTITLGPAERSVLDVRFREPGMFMFHAHVQEFAELGWTGMFMVE